MRLIYLIAYGCLWQFLFIARAQYVVFDNSNSARIVHSRSYSNVFIFDDIIICKLLLSNESISAMASIINHFMDKALSTESTLAFRTHISRHISNSAGRKLERIYKDFNAQKDIDNLNRLYSYQKLSSHLRDLSSFESMKYKELLLHLSLILWPENVDSMAALAYAWECYGQTSAAQSLYAHCFLFTGNIGCGLHYILAAPTITWDIAEADTSFQRSLALFFLLFSRHYPYSQIRSMRSILCIDSSMLSVYRGCQDIADTPGTIDKVLHALPLSPQYLGMPPAIVYSLLSRSISQLYVNTIFHISPSPSLHSKSDSRSIRLGIVSESYGNTSPGLCIQQILDSIVGRKVFSDKEIEIVFFDRPDLATVFGESMRRIAVQTVMLNPNNVLESAQSIVSASVDILLYLALSTERLSFLLGHFRLAPIQVQYGVGHPFSSGIGSIDYSVVPFEMVPSLWYPRDMRDREQLSDETALRCAEAAYRCDRDDTVRALTCSEYERCSRLFSYSEQVVLFDSLAYYIPDPIDMYSEDDYSVTMLSTYSLNRIPFIGGPAESDSNNVYYRLDPPSSLLSCDALDDKLLSWGIGSNITARDIGCYNKAFVDHSKGQSTYEVVVGEVVLYSCIQGLKKFHPIFDKVLIGILQADESSKILVFDSFKAVLPRLVAHSSFTMDDLYSRFIFVPRLPHVEYLSLLSLAALFLNPFPFGAGITSSDALAMCVPVLVMVETGTGTGLSSVLSFAAAQVRAFGPEIESLLTVHTEDAFVQRAVDIAHSKIISHHELRDRLCAGKRRALFGETVLQEASNEWAAFLFRITQ